jgi:hypothetical protein
MKNALLKALVVLMVLALGIPSFGQKIGVQAGFNLSEMHYNFDTGDTEVDEQMNEDMKEFISPRPGFHIGVMGDVELAEFLSLQGGLLFTTKGYKMEMEDNVTGEELFKMKGHADLYYLELPIMATANIPLADEVDFRVSAGPYVGAGLFGKAVAETEFMGEITKEENDIEWGEDGDMKRLDYGATFGAGLRFNAFELGASYDLGLADLVADPDISEFCMKNRVLKFHGRYWF